MLNEESIAIEARLIAIEHLLTFVAKTAYLLGKVPDALVRQAHESIRQGLREETFSTPDVDPTLKDHFAASIYENADRLLGDFERALRDARAPKTQQ
jgi:hypothetical protein